jgi:hypothetical protein
MLKDILDTQENLDISAQETLHPIFAIVVTQVSSSFFYNHEISIYSYLPGSSNNATRTGRRCILVVHFTYVALLQKPKSVKVPIRPIIDVYIPVDSTENYVGTENRISKQNASKHKESATIFHSGQWIV